VRTPHAATLALLVTGCSAVKMYRLEPDYAAVDRAHVKRLTVVTSVARSFPFPSKGPLDDVLGLWSLMARRYVNQKRDTFIAKRDLVGHPTEHWEAFDVFSPKAVCAEDIEGVLWLDPKFKRAANGVEAEVRAQLVRCGDGAVIWEAQGAGSWPSEDEHLKETTAQYVRKFGPEVGPYVAPTFHLLKAVLDTLPVPAELTDEEKDEKISLDD
jgi:probable lipoprotein (TIGR04455 family)